MRPVPLELDEWAALSPPERALVALEQRLAHVGRAVERRRRLHFVLEAQDALRRAGRKRRSATARGATCSGRGPPCPRAPQGRVGRARAAGGARDDNAVVAKLLDSTFASPWCARAPCPAPRANHAPALARANISALYSAAGPVAARSKEDRVFSRTVETALSSGLRGKTSCALSSRDVRRKAATAGSRGADGRWSVRRLEVMGVWIILYYPSRKVTVRDI